MAFSRFSSLVLLALSIMTITLYCAEGPTHLPFEDRVEKKAGDTIKFTVEFLDPTTTFRLYRLTEPSGEPAFVKAMPPNNWTYEIQMPDEAIKRYRYFARPIDTDGSEGPATNEVLIVRVP